MKLYISAKCDDRCETSTKLRYEAGYPPKIVGLCGSDYVDFGVDTETGTILNWDIIKKQLIEQGFLNE